ncbi:MAG: helix-turn-helix transcriptional regulator [Candidatus Acidiferrales bacterium]
MQDHLTVSQTAKIIGVSHALLQSWRDRHVGPPYVKLSRRMVVYPSADLERWLEERRSDYQAPR